MCGLIAGAAGRTRRAALGYHAARLAGYGSVGAAAGGLGAGIDQIGGWAGIAGAAARVAGFAMVAVGGAAILTTIGARRRSPAGWSHGMVTRIAARGRALPPVRRAVLLGAVTALLPCGWLYAFVVAAAGTGSPSGGMTAMALFWAGTVPAVAAASALIGRLSGPLRARLPLVSATVLILFGLLTAFGRTAPRHSGAPELATHVHPSR
jgi:sulfite exporter TauE/SafE